MFYHERPLPKLTKPCAFCTGDIVDGDEYIENEEGEVMHIDCAYFIDRSNLLEWLGIETKEVCDVIIT